MNFIRFLTMSVPLYNSLREKTIFIKKGIKMIFKREKEKKQRLVRAPKLWESFFSMSFLVLCLSFGIVVFKADPHIPMFVGSFGSIIIAFRLGFKWTDIESFIMKGISKVVPSIVILMVIGALIGVWLDSGVVPTMIYYGLKILRPSFFYVATVLICSITSLATGSSWGTIGTMGVAFMGIAFGLSLSLPITAGAIISGAYFGDKMSPLSDTTNLAPAMAGCDVMTNIRFMILPTSISYALSLVIFFVLGLGHNGSAADFDSVTTISSSLSELFHISPLYFFPVILVLVAVALKLPSIPGITLGIISGATIGLLLQPNCTMYTLLNCAVNGFSSSTGIESLDKLLSTGGLLSMMYASSMAMIAMIFGGVMEETGQLTAISHLLTRKITKPADLVTLTEATSILSNVIMPDQYISIIVPGRMFVNAYNEMDLHPKTLSNALSSSGAVTSALVPWNTCGLYISTILGLSVVSYLPFAFFNYLTPIVVMVLSYLKITVADKNGNRLIQARKSSAIYSVEL